jgi:micrococcal nuclease
MPARAPSLGALALLAILIAVIAGGGCEGDPQPGDSDGGSGGERAATVQVLDVVDGDTIEVDLDGVEEDVRYIGIDTPESVAPDQPVECFGVEASELNQRLVGDAEVRLVFDAERRDDYGRLLAYVYRGDGFVNAELVRRGYARTLTIEPNDRFAARFERLQQAAANAGRGLWAAC